MIKSKHFRKDVIIARVIFLCLCILLVAGIVWLVSMFTNGSNKESTQAPQGVQSESPSDDNESQIPGNSETEDITQPDTEPDSTPDTQPDTEPDVEPETPVYVKVTAKSLNVREEPNTTCTVIASLKKGDKVQVLEELEEWYKITYDGKEGYISKTYAKIVTE